ncbi:MAG: hypothetical protein EA425_16575 [Puniceicoccaceae bacterium]|nr:MAG: hypothetical protein EA425_16575 [Puniceicoccaceae bacterium]
MAEAKARELTLGAVLSEAVMQRFPRVRVQSDFESLPVIVAAKDPLAFDPALRDELQQQEDAADAVDFTGQ